MGVVKTWQLDAHKTASPIDHPDASITPVKLSFGSLKKVAEVNVTSNTTQVTITGLDIKADKFYLIVFTTKNPTATSGWVSMYVEADTTAANYYSQYFHATGTGLAGGLYNAAYIGHVDSGDRNAFIVWLVRDPDGYPRFNCYAMRKTGSGTEINLNSGSKTATVTNITRLDFIHDVAGGIGAGSKIIIYGASG